MKRKTEQTRGKKNHDLLTSVVFTFYRWWDFRGLLRTRGDRHRFFLVACIAFFGQWDLPPTSYYFPLLCVVLTLICVAKNTIYLQGRTGGGDERAYCPAAQRVASKSHILSFPSEERSLFTVQTPIMMISALCGLRQIEKWGRRPTLLFSSTGMCICVVAITVRLACLGSCSFLIGWLEARFALH